MWDVFAADGSAYTEEAPLTFDLSDTNNKTKVVSRVYVTFSENKSADFGKDANGNVTGKFMTAYNVSGVSVKVYDFENKPINDLKSIEIKLTHGNDSQSYGGYTSKDLTNAVADCTIKLDSTTDNITFGQSEVTTLKYAGSYTTTVSLKIGEQTISYAGDKLPANAPKFTVSSAAPSVKITSAYYKSADDSGTASSFTDTTTTVYRHTSKTEICNVGLTTNYKPAYVNIDLSGYGNASGATLEFTTNNSDGKVHLYAEGQQNNGTATTSYQWTGDGSCRRYVGFVEQKDNATDSKKSAGTLTATQLVLSYGNMSFVVDIADITIINAD
jgi:hypothetical protein